MARCSSLTRVPTSNLLPFFLSFSLDRPSFFSSSVRQTSAVSGGSPVEVRWIPVDVAEADFASRCRRLRSRSHARRFSIARFASPRPVDSPVDMLETNLLVISPVISTPARATRLAALAASMPPAISAVMSSAVAVTPAAPRRQEPPCIDQPGLRARRVCWHPPCDGSRRP